MLGPEFFWRLREYQKFRNKKLNLFQGIKKANSVLFNCPFPSNPLGIQ